LLEDIYEVGTQEAEVAEEVKHITLALKNRLLPMYYSNLEKIRMEPTEAMTREQEEESCLKEVKTMLEQIYSTCL